jgi:hypothetical protein
MLKPMFNVLRIFISAPFIVTLGITILILGGLSGGRWLYETIPSPNLTRNDLIVKSFETFKTSTNALIGEVRTLKGETQSLMIQQTILQQPETAYTLLGYSKDLQSGELLPRRDPFAPIAPPGNENLLVQRGQLIPAKVNAPGDS